MNEERVDLPLTDEEIEFARECLIAFRKTCEKLPDQMALDLIEESKSSMEASLRQQKDDIKRLGKEAVENKAKEKLEAERADPDSPFNQWLQAKKEGRDFFETFGRDPDPVNP